MKEINAIIQNLYKIRNVPQYLFMAPIHPQSNLKVRKDVVSLRSKNPLNDINEIDFILQSPGGRPDDAYRIIRTLRKNFEIVNIIIPFWAKSAATLISLGGTKIIMDEFGELGPLDIQIPKEREDSPDIDRESALNDEHSLKRIESRSLELFQTIFTNIYASKNIPINKNELSKQILEYLSKFYEPLLSQINPYKLGEKKRKLDIGEHYANRILTLYNPDLSDQKKNFLIDYLVNGCPDHGYIIDYDLISIFLPNVEKSHTFGEEYALCLTELSNHMIKDDYQNEVIGFIPAISINSNLTKRQHSSRNRKNEENNKQKVEHSQNESKGQSK